MTEKTAVLERPSESQLSLHNRHLIFNNFGEFQPKLLTMLKESQALPECAEMISQLGIIEPLTYRYIAPEQIQITGSNYRESMLAGGCLSRNRAQMLIMERLYGSLQSLQMQHIYLAEAVSGFAMWTKQHLHHVVTSEYLDKETESAHGDVRNEDICELSFANASFDLSICNELFEHVKDLNTTLRELRRILRPGGRLLATFPMAFGQHESITRATWDKTTESVIHLQSPDYHGDPIRPETGSLVYRIPGWEVLNEAKAAGFNKACIHSICSWKHGILGIDIPDVLVMEAQA